MPAVRRGSVGWIAALGLAGCGATTNDGFPPTTRLMVSRVIDGDTLVVRSAADVVGPAGQPLDETRVRLLGVDTPELAASSGRAECWAEEARVFAERAAEGRRVTLAYDPVQCRPATGGAACRDVYGRLLAYVLVDGEVLNERLLDGGHARAFGSGRYTHRDASRYTDLERAARRAGRGQWGSCP